MVFLYFCFVFLFLFDLFLPSFGNLGLLFIIIIIII